MSAGFEFATATRIVFGCGRFAEGGKLIAALGRRALVVSNADRAGRQGLLARLARATEAESVTTEVVWIRGEPRIEDVDRALETARRVDAAVIVGLGGGSAIDTAKAVAGLAANGGSCLDYMEVIGGGRAFERPALPWIAVPTTAGTGAEVTRNAVVGSTERAYKASLRSPLLLARVALVDPELALGLSPDITARCGMDALTQCIESYVSNGASPLTDPLAREGIRRASRSLRRAVEDGSNLAARADLALAALLSGITLTNAGLGAVHGLAAPLGARFPVPHGTACAALLPHVMRANVDALRAADARHPALERYAEVGRLLSGDPTRAGEDAVDAGLARSEELLRELRIPGLARFGVAGPAVAGIVEMARRASSMRFNPIALSAAALAGVLRRALGDAGAAA